VKVTARVAGIEYAPVLCRELPLYPMDQLEEAFSQESAFLLKTNSKRQLAISHWVSPKRTRSYPYARVYDTLNYDGKRVAIIPVMKDEGLGGDRDYIQYDTLTLMGLLGVYVIISYYKDAERSQRYPSKITAQRFDFVHIQRELERLENYQSDALHWNMQQVEQISEVAQRAIEAYRQITLRLGVELHSFERALKRLEILKKNRQSFIEHSRMLAREAQERETQTIQPKENLHAQKATLTIENFLGGVYYFTCDEVYTRANQIFLVEAKHSQSQLLPALEDIKDGLLRMVFLTNLKEVTVDRQSFEPIAVLRLTSGKPFVIEHLTTSQWETLRLLEKEAENNDFYVIINKTNLNRLER